jgi:hypothetical protein
MKETLRDRLLSEITRIDARIKQLEKHVTEYKDDADYENAMKCDIRMRMLIVVSGNLNAIL